MTCLALLLAVAGGVDNTYPMRFSESHSFPAAESASQRRTSNNNSMFISRPSTMYCIVRVPVRHESRPSNTVVVAVLSLRTTNEHPAFPLHVGGSSLCTSLAPLASPRLPYTPRRCSTPTSSAAVPRCLPSSP